jgi:hypothetical protein
MTLLDTCQVLGRELAPLRRTREGRSQREIMRCLKRYIAAAELLLDVVVDVELVLEVAGADRE